MSKEISKLDQASIDIVKSINALGNTIQKHLIDLMKHVIKSGDVTPAYRFVTLLQGKLDEKGKSKSPVRPDAIKTWLRDFAFVSFGEHGAKLNKAARKSACENIDTTREHVKLATANKWNVYTKAETKVSAFDLVALIKAAVKRAEDREIAVQSGEIILPADKKDNIPHDMLDAIKLLLVATPE